MFWRTEQYNLKIPPQQIQEALSGFLADYPRYVLANPSSDQLFKLKARKDPDPLAPMHIKILISPKGEAYVATIHTSPTLWLLIVMILLVVCNVYAFSHRDVVGKSLNVLAPLVFIIPYLYYMFKMKLLLDLKRAFIPNLMNTKEGVLEQWIRNSSPTLAFLKAQNALYLTFCAIAVFIAILLITNQFERFCAFIGISSF